MEYVLPHAMYCGSRTIVIGEMELVKNLETNVLISAIRQSVNKSKGNRIKRRLST